jgi:membrane protease YdiL (CAAX protease family)
MILGAIYEKTENIVVPSLVHGVYNAILFTSLYFQVSGGA